MSVSNKRPSARVAARARNSAFFNPNFVRAGLLGSTALVAVALAASGAAAQSYNVGGGTIVLTGGGTTINNTAANGGFQNTGSSALTVTGVTIANTSGAPSNHGVNFTRSTFSGSGDGFTFNGTNSIIAAAGGSAVNFVSTGGNNTGIGFHGVLNATGANGIVVSSLGAIYNGGEGDINLTAQTPGSGVGMSWTSVFGIGDTGLTGAFNAANFATGISLTATNGYVDFHTGSGAITGATTGITAQGSTGVQLTIGSSVSASTAGINASSSAGAANVTTTAAIVAPAGISVSGSTGASVTTSGAGTIDSTSAGVGTGISATGTSTTAPVTVNVGAQIGGTTAPQIGVLVSSAGGLVTFSNTAAIHGTAAGLRFARTAGGVAGTVNVGADVIGGIDASSGVGFTYTVAAGATVSGSTSTGFGAGAIVTNNSGSVVNNSGSITSTGVGVDNAGLLQLSGGSLTNTAAGVISGRTGVSGFSSAVTTVNAGTIIGTGTAATEAGIVTGGSTITNSGSISGAYNGVRNLNNAFTLNNQATGTITGAVNGFSEEAGNARFTITNAGVIQTLGGVAGTGAAGILLNSASTQTSTITNTGTISGGSDATNGFGVNIANGALTLTNQSGGSITGGIGGIRLASDDLATLNLNLGSTVTGQILSTSTGARTLTIAGLLDGAYNAAGGTGIDTITLASTGSITGAIALGAGDDVFNWQGGVIGGTINAGAGTGDIFNSALGAGNSASLSLSNLTGFETYNHQSGSLTLTGSRNGGPVWNLSANTTLNLAGSLTNVSGSGFAITATAPATVNILSTGVLTDWVGIYFNGPSTDTVNNAGTITATQAGITTSSGAVNVTNTSTGTITSSASDAISLAYGPSTITNDGVLTGAANTGYGVSTFVGPTTVNNHAGTISGGAGGLRMGLVSGSTNYGGLLTVTNAAGAQISGGTGIVTAGAGALTLTNAGDVVGTNGAIAAGGGGAVSITNSALGLIGTGASSGGVYTFGGTGYAVDLAIGGTINNSGTIRGGGAAIYSRAGTLNLTNTGAIRGGQGFAGNVQDAIWAQGATILNSGSITVTDRAGTVGQPTYAAINLGSGGGTVTNAAGGVLEGGTDLNFGRAVQTAGVTTFNNYGTATGGAPAGTGFGQLNDQTSTIILHAGSVTGSVVTGAANDTLAIYSGRGTAGTATVDVASGITLQNAGALAAATVGTVDLGGGTDTLQLRGTGDGTAANGTTGLLDIGGNPISTAEILTKLDAGTWTLTGAAVTPGIRINAGDGGTPGSDGLLIFDGTTGLTGDIYVNAATIRATGSGAFGTGAIHMIDPTVQFAGGSYNNAFLLEVQSPATSDPSRFQSVGTGTPVIVLSGRISQGSGGGIDALQPVSFSTDGAGTPFFLLTNQTNSWAGVTTIDAGVTVEGSSAAVSGGSLVTNGNLTLNNGATSLTEARNISGTGSFYDRGSGTMTLTGVGSWTGNTSVETGATLIGTTSSIGGNYFYDDGAIVFDQSFDGARTFGTFGGSGSLSIVGTGQVTLNGGLYLNGTVSVSGAGSRLVYGGGSRLNPGASSDSGYASGFLVNGANANLTIAATGFVPNTSYIGVRVTGQGASVTNLGSITNVGTAGADAVGAGVAIYTVGGANTVTNGSASNATALISGNNNAINQRGSATTALTVNNFGVLVSDRYNAVENSGAAGAMTVNNTGAAATIVARGNAGQGRAISHGSAATLTVLNSGRMIGSTEGIFSNGAATITNSGTIGAGTLSGVTTGTYVAGGSSGITLNTGGSVTNQLAGVIRSSINGLTNAGGATSVANAGTINGDSGSGVRNNGAGVLTFTNGGTVAGGSYGVYSVGRVDANVTGGTITGGIYNAFYLAAANSSVINAGTLVGGNAAIYADGANLTIQNSGTIRQVGGSANTVISGIYSAAAGTQITNTSTGTIESTLAGGRGVNFAAGGSVTNAGTISGPGTGILSAGGALTVTNTGTIGAASGYGIQNASATGVSTIANQSGGVIGGGAGSILLSGAGNTTINLMAGSTTNGQILSTAGGTHTVNISGVLNGAYDASTGSGVDILTLVSTGSMTSASLGAGNDTFNYYGGTISGVVDGGLGTDSLFADFGVGASFNVSLANFSGFETIGLISGDLTLTGPSGSPGATIYAGNGGTGLGTVTFTNTGTNTGDIYVNGADIRATTAGAFGTGTIHLIDPTAFYGATGTYANNISLEVQSPASGNPSTLSADAGVVATLTGAITQGVGAGVDASQPLVIAGLGTVVLTNTANSWAGVTTINAGATLQGAANTISGGSISNNGTLAFNQVADGTFGLNISGAGGVRSIGGANLTLSGSNTYSGATIINAGALTASGGSAIGDTSAVTVAAGAVFQQTGAETIGSLSGAGAVRVGALNLTIGGDNSSTEFSGSITDGGGFGYIGSWRVSDGVAYGTRPPIYSGQEAAALLFGGSAADYRISTVSNQIGQINDSAWYSGYGIGWALFTDDRHVDLGAPGYSQSGDYSTYVHDFSDYSRVNYAFGPSLTQHAGGGVTHIGTGTLILSGVNTYTGATLIQGGSIELRNGAAIADAGLIDISAGASLIVTNAETVGNLTGAGSTTLAGDLTLSGATGTYAGDMNGAGALNINGSGAYTLAGDLSNAGGVLVSTLTTRTLTIDATGSILTDGGAVVTGGAGSVSLVNAGYVGSVNGVAVTMNGAGILTNQNGGVIASNGTAVLLSGAASHTLDLQGGSSVFGAIDASTATGANVVTLAGLLDGAYLGGLGTDTFTLLVGGGASGVIDGGADVDSFILGGTGNASLDAAQAINFESRIMDGTGTWTLTGVDASAAGWTLNSGILALSGGAAINDLAGVTVGAGGTLSLLNDETIGALTGAGLVDLGASRLTLSDAQTTTYSGVISGLGGLTIGADNALTLSGANTYMGATLVDGRLTLGASGVLADASALLVGATGTVDLQAFDETVNFAGIFGTLDGTGMLTASQYELTGATVNANLGAGNLFNLDGVSTLNGTSAAAVVAVFGGTLTLGDDERLSDAASLQVDFGATLDLQGFDETVNYASLHGLLDGTGTLTAGTYELDGATINANLGAGTTYVLGFDGRTSVLNGASASETLSIQQGGVLQLGAAERLSDTAAVMILAGSTLDIQGFDETTGDLSVGGTLDGAGTLTAAGYNLNGATINANLGAGVLNVFSSGALLNGTSAAATVYVQGGVLQLGASERLSDLGSLYVLGGGALDLQAFDETVGSVYLTDSTLSGTGTLTADAYYLDGATIDANLGAGDLFAYHGVSILNGAAGAGTVSVSGGTLQLGASDRLADTATLGVSSGATLDLQGFDETVDAAVISGLLSGTGTLTASQYQLSGAVIDANLGAGVLFNTGGVSVLNGTSRADLVSVLAGTLSLGASDLIVDTADLQVATGATFDLGAFDQTVNVSELNGALTGVGTLTAVQHQLDGATIDANLAGDSVYVIGGASTLNGQANVDLLSVLSGSLALGGSNRIVDTAVLGVSSGATLNMGAFNETVAVAALGGTLDGSGTLTAGEYQLNGATVNANLGAGALFQLSGVSTLNGASAASQVSVNAGTLSLGAANRLADTATVVVASGGILNLGTFNDTVGVLALGGTLNGAGTLTAGQYQLTAGTVNANLGAGTLFNVSGASVLNGLSAADLVLLQAGSLRLGASDRLSDTSTVSVASGATLNLNGFNERIGALFGMGDVDVGAGRLTFGGTDSGFGGRLSGTGSVVHTGGLFTLMGDHTIASISNTGGELRFIGTTTGGISLNGGSLTGAGTIGGALAVSNGAILSPGLAGQMNGVGGFTVGSLTMNGGRLALDVLGTSGGNLIDQIRVNGTATLTGGVVAPNFHGTLADFNFSSRYLFLSANNVVGVFQNGAAFTAADQAGLFWRIRYDLAPNSAVLELRELTDFDPGTSGTDNQRKVGQALTGGQLGASDDFAGVLATLAGLSGDTRLAAFDSIGGEALADMTTSLFGANDAFINAVRDGGSNGGGDGGDTLDFAAQLNFAGRDNAASRLGDVLGAFDPAATAARGSGGWVSAYSADQTLEGKAGQATVESRLNGFAGGYSIHNGPVSLGAAAGVSRMEGDVDSRASHYESDLTHAAGFVAYDDGAWLADVTATVFGGDLDSRRVVQVGAFSGRAIGSTHSEGQSISASVARRFQVGEGGTVALGAIGTASNASVDGFTEVGAGGLSLQASGLERNWQTLQLSARATQDYRVDGRGIRVYGGLGAMATAGDREAVGDMRFTGSPTGFGTFTIEGAEAPPMAGIADFGVEVSVGDGVTVSAGYRGVFSERLEDNLFGAKLKVRW